MFKIEKNVSITIKKDDDEYTLSINNKIIDKNKRWIECVNGAKSYLEELEQQYKEETNKKISIRSKDILDMLKELTKKYLCTMYLSRQSSSFGYPIEQIEYYLKTYSDVYIKIKNNKNDEKLLIDQNDLTDLSNKQLKIKIEDFLTKD